MDFAPGLESVGPSVISGAPQNGFWGSDRQLTTRVLEGVGRVPSGRKAAAGAGHLQSRSHTWTMERTSRWLMQLAL